MSATSNDGTDPELSMYAPKWARERATTPDADESNSGLQEAERSRPLSPSASPVLSFKEERRDRRIRSLSPERVPQPPVRRDDGLLLTGDSGEDGLRAVIGRSVKVAAVAALAALLAIFGRPLLQRVALAGTRFTARTSLQTI